MAEGTSTFEGLSLPRLGEYEQVQQTVATDMVTLTGGTSQTGDFIVCQDVDGTEKFVVGVYGDASYSLSSTLQAAAITINVTSTGGLQAIGTVEHAVNGLLISAGSKAVMNCAIAYHAVATSTPEADCKTFLGVLGSRTPDYLLSFGASAIQVGAAATNGFFDHSLTINTFTCDHPFGGVKILAGSIVYYMLAVQESGVT